MLCLFFLFTLRALALIAIPPHPDEVIQNYMTDDIAHFRNFPAYFYGQEFMGPLESYLLAPLLRVFGSSYLTARFWNEMFYAAFVILYLGVVKRLFDREVSGYLLLLLSVPPFPILFFTTIVGYGEILPLAVLSLVLLLKVASESETGQGGGAAVAAGFVAGLAFWCNPIFVIWLVPLAISLGALIPSTWKRKIPLRFTAGFALGLFPVWLHALQTGTPMWVHTAGNRFIPLKDLPRLAYLFFARMKYFLTTSFFERPSWLGEILPSLAVLPLSFFLVSFGTFLFSFLRSFREQGLQKKIFFLFVTTPPLILMGLYLSRDLTTDEGIRYFLPLAVSYPFTVAWWVRAFRSAFWKRAALISLTGILLGISLASLGAQDRQRRNFIQIFHFLEQNQLRYGVGDLSAAYTMDAFSQNQIQVTPALYEIRIRPLWNRVRDQRPQFLVFESFNHRFLKRLESDPRLKKVVVGGRDVFYGSSELLEEILETKEPL